jgi:hypothetical protein
MTPLRSVRPRSLLRYSPALLAFIFVVADAGRWADPDLWGHLVFGRLILERPRRRRPQADEARRHGGDDYLARDGRG